MCVLPVSYALMGPSNERVESTTTTLCRAACDDSFEEKVCVAVEALRAVESPLPQLRRPEEVGQETTPA